MIEPIYGKPKVRIEVFATHHNGAQIQLAASRLLYCDYYVPVA